ncbi:MAG: hypothetical protein Fur0016_29310 [Anaerolineales bacterium]
MKILLRKIWRFILQPQKIQALFGKIVFTSRVSGWRGVWFAGQKYLRAQWHALRGIDTEKNFLIRQQIDEILSALQPVKDGVIFISHDASATGAPITLLNQCKAYKQVYGNNLLIVLMTGGEIVENFRAVAPVIDLHQDLTDIIVDENVHHVFSRLKQLGYSRCIANTVGSGALQKIFSRNNLDVIYEVHELLQTIQHRGWGSYAKNIARSGSIVIFPAHYVANKFISQFKLPAEYVRILPQGVSLIYEGGKSLAREKLLDQLGLSSLSDVKIILGAGFAYHRKGTDLFCEVAAEFHKKQRLNVHFIWLGHRDQYFEHWITQILPELPYKKNIHFWDFDPQPAHIFAGADVFLLTSREDPFPSVALEALANDTPVITFKDTGGIEEILDGTNGVVVEHLNVEMMAEAAWKILQNPQGLRASSTKLQTYPEFIKSLIALFPNHKDGKQPA